MIWTDWFWEIWYYFYNKPEKEDEQEMVEIEMERNERPPTDFYVTE